MQAGGRKSCRSTTVGCTCCCVDRSQYVFLCVCVPCLQCGQSSSKPDWLPAGAWGGCKLVAAVVGDRALALQLHGSLEKAPGKPYTLEELVQLVPEMVREGSIVRLAQVYPGGGHTRGHSHGKGTDDPKLKVWQKQFHTVRLCEALSGTTWRAGSKGWQYSVVMGLLGAFGMDAEGDGTRFSSQAAAAAGGEDVKAHGVCEHIAAVPPAHGVSSVKTGTASSGAAATLCWKISSSRLVEGSLQKVAARYATSVFSDSSNLRLLKEGMQLAAFCPTARMVLREMPPTSSIWAGMTQHGLLMRELGASGTFVATGGRNCQRNTYTLRSTQVGAGSGS